MSTPPEQTPQSSGSSEPPKPTPLSARAEETFNCALELPPAEREAFLARACGDETTLLTEVRELLAAHEMAGSFMTSRAPRLPEIKADPARGNSEKAGERIGAYKLLQQIGEGGFGTVWMAEQEQPVQRRVALKIIKVGMDTKEVVARFEQERQALALMDHPNIAKVFEAGATPTGRPFFVMELVRGIKITDYCDQSNLSTAERLRLFIGVCHAVQHAHQKGIIHRDLKPSNILVTLHDGIPVPKVIDFGVAKATQQRLTDLTLFTRFEQMVGTPVYMSPEQAEMSGLDIDTRTDIYALGVLLYELLTGRTPFDPTVLLKRGLDEIRRTIREEEPPRPSTALSTMALDEMTTIAQHRQSDGSKLVGLLRGDLDWIVMKAIEKDRTRRYDSVNAFAEDIHRHLTSQPVAACPPSMGYRLQKLLRRHKVAFVTVSAVAVSLVGGIAVSSWQAVRATHAERIAREERLKAISERDRARAAELRAEDQRQVAEQGYYTARMNLAQAAWERANIKRLRELLEETRTNPDRGFEWYYWQRKTHLESLTLQDGEATVSSVAFSPQGRRIVTGHLDNTARVWDAATGRQLLTFGEHTGMIYSVAFSPNGRHIVTGSGDNTAMVWDAETGRPLLSLKGHADAVDSVAFDQDGRRIVTASADKTVRVWDAETGRELLNLKGDAMRINSATFSPDGRRIATAGHERTAKVWDAETGRELLTLKGHTAPVVAVAFAPDGRRIVTASSDNTAKVWNAETGSELLTFHGHSHFLQSVAYSNDGRWIVTGSRDNTAKVWSAETGRELLTLKGHTAFVTSTAFAPDDRQIMTGSADGTAKVWDVGPTRDTLNASAVYVSSVVFASDGLRIVMGGYDCTARVWDAQTGRELLALRGHTQQIESAAISDDNRRIVTGSYDRTARVWDTETGRELHVLKGHIDPITSVAFAPGGRRIVTGSFDNTARIWNAETGRELLILKPNIGRITAVAFAPDGRRIAIGGYDNTVRIWDTGTSRELLALRGHGSRVSAVTFSPDGRRIVTGNFDCTAKVWDTETGRELLTLKGHDAIVTAVAFAPDGRRIVTGSYDNTARLWNADTGHELLTLHGHTGPLRSVAFAPDGRRIVTASQDQTIRIWMADSSEQVASRKQEPPPAAD